MLQLCQRRRHTIGSVIEEWTSQKLNGPEKSSRALGKDACVIYRWSVRERLRQEKPEISQLNRPVPIKIQPRLFIYQRMMPDSVETEVDR